MFNILDKQPFCWYSWPSSAVNTRARPRAGKRCLFFAPHLGWSRALSPKGGYYRAFADRYYFFFSLGCSDTEKACPSGQEADPGSPDVGIGAGPDAGLAEDSGPELDYGTPVLGADIATVPDYDGRADQEGSAPSYHCSYPLNTCPCVGIVCLYCHPDGTCLTEPECVSDEGCDDGNACVADQCVSGQCAHQAIDGCVPCTSLEECGYNGGTNGIPHYGYTCDTGLGRCVPPEDECQTDADCEDGDPCTPNVCTIAYQAGGAKACGVSIPYNYCTCLSDIDCYWTEKQTCSEGKVCVDGVLSEKVGDGNICASVADCIGSVWGPYCVPNEPDPIGNLCQECVQNDADGNGVDDGCPAERPRCSWGLWGWPDEGVPYRSIYMCQEE